MTLNLIKPIRSLNKFSHEKLIDSFILSIEKTKSDLIKKSITKSNGVSCEPIYVKCIKLLSDLHADELYGGSLCKCEHYKKNKDGTVTTYHTCKQMKKIASNWGIKGNDIQREYIKKGLLGKPKGKGIGDWIKKSMSVANNIYGNKGVKTGLDIIGKEINNKIRGGGFFDSLTNNSWHQQGPGWGAGITGKGFFDSLTNNSWHQQGPGWGGGVKRGIAISTAVPYKKFKKIINENAENDVIENSDDLKGTGFGWGRKDMGDVSKITDYVSKGADYAKTIGELLA